MTSSNHLPKAPPPLPSRWRLGLPHMNWGWGTDIPPITGMSSVYPQSQSLTSGCYKLVTLVPSVSFVHVSPFSGRVVGEKESEFRREPLTLPSLFLLEGQAADCTVQGVQNVIWILSHKISSGSVHS